MPTLIALDSVRSYDTDGRLHISRTRISKACVNPYLGREIPGFESLGLDANKVYKLLRDPGELAKGASTFERNQILSKHIPVNSSDPQNEVIAGAIGSNVEFVEPYLWADVSIWDDQAIAGIETNTIRQFSCAYHYVPVMTPGVYQGEAYDGVMTEIRGNHLALVEAGRAGSDVLAADSEMELPNMKPTKKGKALIVTLGALSPKLAQDSALPTLVGGATVKKFNKADVTAKLIAIDADLDAAKLAIVMDAVMDPVAEDSDDDDDKKDKKKIAEDSDEDDDDDKKDKKKIAADSDDDDDKKKPAMDAAIKLAVDSSNAILRKELREAYDARIAVRPILGDVAMDSAPEIYSMALDHMKVEHAGVQDLNALKAIFSVANRQSSAPAPVVAMDAAGAATRFPGMDRFKQA